MTVSTRSSTARKRKASPGDDAGGPRKSLKISRQADAPFRFMDLSAELRNLVYASYARTRIAYLKNGALTDNSPLLEVNAQVRDEYIPMLIWFAKAIKTRVVDFDFGHIVTFLDNISAPELVALPPAGSIDIALRFSYIPEVEPPDDKLRRWLNRASTPTNDRHWVNSRYSLVARKQMVRPGAHRHWRWTVATEGTLWEPGVGDRAKQEARKIIQTLSA